MPLKFIPWKGNISKDTFDEGFRIVHGNANFGYISHAVGAKVYEWHFNVTGPYGGQGKSRTLEAAQKKIDKLWAAWLKNAGLMEIPDAS